MNIVKMQKYLKTMYDVSDVKRGYDYWYFKLFNILLDMFEWHNLPEGLTSREIELNLMMTGHAMICAKKDGTLFTPLTNLFGYDEYYQPTWAVYANPVVTTAHRYTIGVDCEVIYNSKLKDSLYYYKADSGLNTFVQRYARQLADIESTINIFMVNSRLVSIPVADDGNVMESLKAFFKKLTLGQRAIVSDSTIIEKFRNVDINRTAIHDGINDLLIARDKILEQFFREVGIKMNQPKKAQMNVNEVESNNQLLLLASDDMLQERTEGGEKVNNLYGCNIYPTLNPKFDVSIQEQTSESEVDGNAET